MLITGATGMIGSHLRQHLSANGFIVRGLSRTAGPGVDYVQDLTAAAIDWPAILCGIDTVIHCAAISSAPSGKPGAASEELYRLNRDATASLARACLNNGVRRLVFTSSAKVYGDYSAPSAPFFEDHPLQPADDYGKSKAQAEDCIQNAGQQGLDVCILRLPLVYGPQLSANLQRIQRMTATGLPLPFASIRNRRSVLGINNLAVVVEQLLRLDSWRFPVINLADPEPVSTPELIGLVAAASGEKANLIPFPIRLLRPLARLAGQEAVFHSLASNLEMHCANLYGLLPGLVLEPTPEAFGRLRGRLTGING